MKYRGIIITAMILAMVGMAYAVESIKPASHDTTWTRTHGQESRVDEGTCLACHKDRVACIKCHQEVQPRSHTPSWLKRGHGLESRWNRDKCTTCHKEDSCVACHSSIPPSDHRPGWGGAADPVNIHCNSCHYPIQETRCFTCHKIAHTPTQYRAP